MPARNTRREPERTLQIDLDEDGVLDTFHSVSGSGSGMSTTDLELVLSRTGKRIEVSSEFSFTAMVNATVVPPELLHAWLYVTLDGGGQKLRFPTVVGGRLEDGRAVIRLSHEQAFYGTYGCGLLRIDLRDGTFSERWRDLESTGAGMEPCWAELEKHAAPARP